MWRIIGLFFIPTLIWGSTWIAIKFQLGTTAPELSVFLRFALATALTGLWAWGRNQRFAFSKQQHFEFFLQGAANYSLNYVLTYHSERYLTSGVVAVIFSLLIIFNIWGLHFFYRQPIERRTLGGALVGGAGILLLFGHEFVVLEWNRDVAWGFVLGTVATLFASLGNMVSLRFRKAEISVLSSNFWAMFYGTVMTLAIAVISGVEWQFPSTAFYWSSLIYLSVFGTVIAFASYMTLIRTLGADKAAYTSIFTPIIALLISTAYESYTWSWINITGIVLALLGNILVLRRPKTS